MSAANDSWLGLVPSKTRQQAKQQFPFVRMASLSAVKYNVYDLAVQNAAKL